MFLNADEMRELTQKAHHAAQVRVLHSMGIKHCARPDGSVAVLRSHIEDLLSSGTKVSKLSVNNEPDWSALNATRT